MCGRHRVTEAWVQGGKSDSVQPLKRQRMRPEEESSVELKCGAKGTAPTPRSPSRSPPLTPPRVIVEVAGTTSETSHVSEWQERHPTADVAQMRRSDCANK